MKSFKKTESLARIESESKIRYAEGQGIRLSSYATSSNKHSPKTPKKSTEKLSTHSSGKEDSLSPHHLFSGHSYNSITSQTKEVHNDCILKCTCINSSYNSLKSLKSNGEKIIKVSKISCDASTSPNRFSQRSPHINLRLITNKDGATSNELRLSDEKKITTKSTASPRRLIATRNAATSPGLEIRKQLSPKQNFELLPKSPDVSTKTLLEKSNSLGESKPSRPLRTTRSLSPRPPVRHQHAITVCDENDIVSVKVSPNEDFDEETNQQNQLNATGAKKKAQSEQTSPNLSDFGTAFTYESCTNNKSTSCLVYVPSDPWLKMSDIEKKSSTIGEKKVKVFTQETRSLSRGNLVQLNNDPWIWRKSTDLSPTANTKKSLKQEAYLQSKSFSITKFDLPDLGMMKISSNKKDKNNSCAKSNRPKLQRSKSPIIIDDDHTPFINDTTASCTCNATESTQQNLLSPRKDTFNKEPAQAQRNNNKSFLNVTNPNLMQTRHSFSSISQKDDELPLNIRRLSEQIKNNTTTTGADFTDYLNQFHCSEAQKAKQTATTRNSSKNSDPVLETTC